MKYVVLTLNDGRLDTYTRAVPIMKKFGVTATINITTDFIVHPDAYSKVSSAANEAVTIDMVRDAQEKGIEIACHSHTHCNEVVGILKSIQLLHEWGISEDPIRFGRGYEN